MIIQCPQCSGRKWVPALLPTLRLYWREVPVVELAQARLYVRRVPCARCLGTGITLSEPKPHQRRRK